MFPRHPSPATQIEKPALAQTSAGFRFERQGRAARAESLGRPCYASLRLLRRWTFGMNGRCKVSAIPDSGLGSAQLVVPGSPGAFCVWGCSICRKSDKVFRISLRDSLKPTSGGGKHPNILQQESPAAFYRGDTPAPIFPMHYELS